MAGEGNFVVGQSSKLVLYAGMSNEVNVRGLNSLTLPLGWTTTFTTISEFGVPVDIQVASGLTYDTLSCSGNFTIKDPTQALLRKWSLNATQITHMRFYLDACTYAALDLVSNAGGYYQIGSMTAPTGEKSGVFSFSLDVAPAGASTLYENHISGTTLTFTADAGSGATVADSGLGFVTAGFKVGQVCYIDHLGGADPIYAKIKAVTAGLMTFEPSLGTADDITSGAGVAATRISSGEAMAFDSTATAC
jgi:hypothetical protein